LDSTVKVREVLSTKGFQGSRVVSGQAGLDNVLKMVTVAEVPDAMDWLIGGELVVTTAYYLKNDPKALEKWVNGLIEHGAVALAIKSSRFIGVIPEVIRRIGNERAFPIIELPPNVTWPKIIESVTNLLLDQQHGSLKHTEEIYDKLMTLVIESKGLNAIAETLGDLIKKPIIIEDRWFNTMAVSPALNKDEEYLLRLRTDPEYLEVLAKTYEDSKQANEIYQEHVLKTPLKTVNQMIFPVPVENRVMGYLTVLLQDEKLAKKEYKVLKHGITVIALEISKQKAMVEAYGRFRLDILRNLLDHGEADTKELQKKALMVGFDLTGPVSAVLIKNHHEEGGVKKDGENLVIFNERIAISLRKKLEEYDPKAFVMIRHDDMVAFLHTEIGERESLDKLKKFLSECLKSVERGKGLRIGIGNAYENVINYKKSYREAEVAVNIGGVFQLDSVVMFPELGYYRLLGLIEDKKGLNEFWQDLIGPILKYDEENKGDLLLTLEEFLNNNGNQAEVARQMFLHANTIPYRLKKIEKLTGMDLNRVDARVTLYLAVSLYKNNVFK